MTLITFNDGKPVMRDGKIGTERECCCNKQPVPCCPDPCLYYSVALHGTDIDCPVDTQCVVDGDIEYCVRIYCEGLSSGVCFTEDGDVYTSTNPCFSGYHTQWFYRILVQAIDGNLGAGKFAQGRLPAEISDCSPPAGVVDYNRTDDGVFLITGYGPYGLVALPTVEVFKNPFP